MNWLYYLLEANLYLLAFYGFYRLFLYNETFYDSNRYYLLLTTVTAFVLPILQLGFLKPDPIINQLTFPMPVVNTETELASMVAAPSTQGNFNFTSYLYPIYLIIALCFAIKLGFSLFKIIKLWFSATKKSTGTFTLVELKDEVTAFSFFNLLFINPGLAQKQAVVAHELVHIKQKHSLDVLFFEILQIICWFNPILYFIKKDIKLLHEYIADELTTNSSMQKHEYALFLIENSFGVIPTPLTNQIFNQSILKRRINMLNKKRTAGWARLRLLLAVPLVAAMLCASTVAFSKDYGYVDLLPEKSKPTLFVQELPKVANVKKQAEKIEKPKKPNVDQVKFPPPVVKRDQVKFPPQDRFLTRYGRDKTTGKPILAEKRYITINGTAVEDLTTFYGVHHAESINYLTAKEAVAKYGEKAKYGAVEIAGKNIEYFQEMLFPPPPKVDVVRFPPPVVKPDKPKKPLKKAPAVEPPPPSYKENQDRTAFKTVKDYPTAKSIEVKEVAVQGYAKNNDATTLKDEVTEKTKEVTVQGYGTKNNEAITVKGYPVDKSKEVKEVVVKGYGSKSNETKEVAVKGYPAKGAETIKVQPIKQN